MAKKSSKAKKESKTPPAKGKSSLPKSGRVTSKQQPLASHDDSTEVDHSIAPATAHPPLTQASINYSPDAAEDSTPAETTAPTSTERAISSSHGDALPVVMNLKGRSVSGRTWKTQAQPRSSCLLNTKVNNRTLDFATRKHQQQSQRDTKDLEKQLKEDRRQEALALKARQLDNAKRRAENELKTIQRSLQTLNHDKVGTTLKAMSKKQLRQVKKSRVNTKTGLVEYVSPWAK